MKKWIAFYCLLIISLQSRGQFSIKASGEYMFPLAQTQLYPGISSIGLNYQPNYGPFTGTYGSLGSGINAGLALDYTFKCNIAAELDVDYWNGFTNNYNTNVTNTEYIITAKQNLNLFMLSPSIEYKIKTHSKVTPYISLGADIAIGEKMHTTYSQNFAGDSTVAPYSYTQNFETNYLVSLGANGQLGINYNLNTHLSFFANLRFDIISLMPDMQTFTSGTTNGTADNLSNEPVNEKEIQFVKALPFSYIPNNNNANQPSLQVALPTAASTFGITIGVEFKFGKSN